MAGIFEEFMANKYYKMSDSELEHEASKWKIRGYGNTNGTIDRQIIIDALLKKDHANTSRLAIGISIAALILSLASILVSIALSRVDEKPATAQKTESIAKIPEPVNQYPIYKGCSNVGDRVCVKAENAKDIVITLDIKPEDECHAKYSRCEPQANGECGWTQSKALDACLDPPRDFIPGPGEKYTIVNGKNGWRAYQEMSSEGQQWFVIESPTSTIRFISGAYPVSFFPIQDLLLIVNSTQLELSGLEVLDLKNATGTKRRLTNIGLPRKPGPLPSEFIPDPIDSGTWVSDTVFRWTVPGDGKFQVDTLSGKVEKR